MQIYAYITIFMAHKVTCFPLFFWDGCFLLSWESINLDVVQVI